MSLCLFGQIDKNRSGRIASEYPAWYYDVHIENLKESIGKAKRALDRGAVQPEMVPVMRVEIERDEAKLSEIENYQPKLSVAEREKLQKLYKEELCPLISQSLFTYTQMQKGLAPAHEEAKRMIKPVLEVNSPMLAEMVEAVGGKLIGKKASRNDVAKVFKLVGRLLGEATNVEVLRRD